MMRDKLVVKEQKPVKCGSVFCEVEIDGGRYNPNGGRSLYFVRDENMNVTQWSLWMESYVDKINLMGYNFKLND